MSGTIFGVREGSLRAEARQSDDEPAGSRKRGIEFFRGFELSTYQRERFLRGFFDDIPAQCVREDTGINRLGTRGPSRINREAPKGGFGGLFFIEGEDVILIRHRLSPARDRKSLGATSLPFGEKSARLNPSP